MLNVEYRNGSITYENEQAAFYRVSESFGDENNGRWLIFPDSLTAVDAYLHSFGEGFTVAGLPRIAMTKTAVNEAGIDEAVVVLEPNETPQGMGNMRDKARFVRLPMPFRKMVKAGYSPTDFNWLIQQARGY